MSRRSHDRVVFRGKKSYFYVRTEVFYVLISLFSALGFTKRTGRCKNGFREYNERNTFTYEM